MDNENLHTEQGLLRLVAAGDMQAYQQLFELYWDQVYGTGLRLTKAPEQAKDLAQDIFLKIWDNRAKLADVRNFSAYLYMTTKNLIHDQMRTRVFRNSNREFLTAYFAYTERSPEQLLEEKEMGEVLEAAINKLPPQLREVINLRLSEGLSHKEIATRLNISYISSKTYMVRALIALRKELGKHSGKLLFITSLLFNLL